MSGGGCCHAVCRLKIATSRHVTCHRDNADICHADQRWYADNRYIAHCAATLSEIYNLFWFAPTHKHPTRDNNLLVNTCNTLWLVTHPPHLSVVTSGRVTRDVSRWHMSWHNCHVIQLSASLQLSTCRQQRRQQVTLTPPPSSTTSTSQ